MSTTIAALKPDAIVRPWTESPAGASPAGASPAGASSDVASPAGASPAGPTSATGAAGAGAGKRALLDTLTAGHAFAASLTGAGFAARARGAASELLGLAAMQLGNDGAIAALDALAAGSKGYYLRFGDPLALDMLPGVSITVLGPPDPDLWPAVRKEAAKSVEYWLGAGSRDPQALEEAHAGREPTIVGDGDASYLLEPGPARWLIDRIDDHLVHSAERLVHQLDGVLNNTSLVLLVEAAGRRLLFPGDAQIENWAYALTAAPDHEAICERLKGVEVYKVGHHGSRNATPRESLYPLLSATGPLGRLALMSTLPGTYGQANKVPSDALIAGLSTAPLKLLRTDGLAHGAKGLHVAATGSAPFAAVAEGD